MRLSGIALLLALALVPIGTGSAQDQPASAQPQQQLLDAGQLDQLVAPIALYPDPLVAQVLMASTYPLEVVQADRFAKANKKLKDEKLKEALDKQDWDASVKELVSTPTVLATMSDQLDWTQKLGDAVLAQQADVMDAIQRLRAKAHANGKLETTKQQTVTVIQQEADQQVIQQEADQQVIQQEADQQVIEIEPASPDVVYVPYYDPAVVYGEWSYPDYPPYYYPPPSGYIVGGAIATGLAWGAAYAVGREIWNDNIDWNGGDINIDVDRNTNIDRNVDIDRNKWQHDSHHRRGVSYKNDAVRNKFAKADTRPADRKLDYRGRSGEQVLKPGTGDRKPGGADRPGALYRPFPAAIVQISAARDRDRSRMSVKFRRDLKSAQESRQLCKARSPISARLRQKAARSPISARLRQKASRGTMPSIEAMVQRPKTSPNAARPASAIVVHRKSHDPQAGAVLRRRARAVAGAEVMSAAAAAAEAMSAAAVADAAESAAAEAVVVVVAVGAAAAGVVPTSASKTTSSRWSSSTTVWNSIASATRAAIEPPMWASWRRRCSKSYPAPFGAITTDI